MIILINFKQETEKTRRKQKEIIQEKL